MWCTCACGHVHQVAIDREIPSVSPKGVSAPEGRPGSLPDEPTRGIGLYTARATEAVRDRLGPTSSSWATVLVERLIKRLRVANTEDLDELAEHLAACAPIRIMVLACSMRAHLLQRFPLPIGTPEREEFDRYVAELERRWTP